MIETDNNIEPPYNFSWIIVGKLAGMASPCLPGNTQFLISQGIKHLVTLSPESPPIPDQLLSTNISWTEIPVEEFEAPTINQIQQFIKICQKAHEHGEGVGVHCRMGRGRTGVMIACYLVQFYDQAPDRAVINVRLMRAGSVETRSQERAVKSYHDHIRKFC